MILDCGKTAGIELLIKPPTHGNGRQINLETWHVLAGLLKRLLFQQDHH
jgi:hypothetical protein